MNYYLVSRSYSSKIRHISDGAYRESPVDEAVVDEHVGYAKHRDPKTLHHGN